MTGEQLTLVEVKDAARELGIDLEGADLDFIAH
jgi:hypothetical protein